MATGICQSATAGSVDPTTSQVLGDADTRPFWAAGLQVGPYNTVHTSSSGVVPSNGKAAPNTTTTA